MSGDNFQHILDSLPEKPPRSRLEPYCGLIDKLRRRGRTYRDIVGTLAEKCGLHVSVSTLHDFVHAQSRQKSKRTEREAADLNKVNRVPAIRRMNTLSQESPTSDEVQERILALKRRSVAVQPTPKLFRYDPDEPLRLSPKPGKSDDGE